MTCFTAEQRVHQFLFGQNTGRQVQSRLPQFVRQKRHLRHIQLQLLHPLHLAENLAGRALHGDFALIHDKDPIGVDRLLHVVGDQNDRDPLLAVELHRRFDDLFSSVGIQHGGGFVENDALGLHCDHAGDRDSLLLSA